MEATTAIEFAKQFGMPVALIVVFIWRDFKREERMSGAMDRMWAAMLEVQGKSILAAADMTSAMKHLADTIENNGKLFGKN